MNRATPGLPSALRGALLLPLAWWTVRAAASTDPWCFVDWVNLAFHEAGHLLFAPFGRTLHVAGGTAGQLLVPAALGARFLFPDRNSFAAALCLWWTGESLVNVSRYVADARDLSLPLVGGGEHDWNSLLFDLGLLDERSVRAIAGGTRGFGAAVMLLGLAWAIWFVLPGGFRDRKLRPLRILAPRLARLLEI